VFAGISAIEMALWDIKGKALKLPVYELLGGKLRERVRLYANGWSFRASTPAEFAAATERPLCDGYTALKLYPLANPIADNPHGMIRHVSLRAITREATELAVARVASVRKAIGPKVELMVDMSGELTTDAIIALGRRLEEFDLLWLEEPVDPFDPEGMREVASALHLPIAAGERLYTRYDFRRLLELRAAHILQPDIGNTGGLLEVKRIAAMAEAWNLRVAPHLCAGPICTAATLQLDATLTNFLIQEVYPYRVSEHFAIVDRAPELEIKGGHLAISDRPGLGVELDRKRMAPFLWAECK
jgi:galactonate dehydratase